MQKLFSFLLVCVLLTACHTVEDKTKKVINKSGEVIGRGASEFAKGISEGVDKTMECKLTMSDALIRQGLQTGSFSVETDSTGLHRNKLVVYFIFEKDLNQSLSFKVYNSKELESGRCSITVNGKAGEAKYYDVVFDARTDIESRNRITIQ
jgi:hypothetical protein